MKKGCTMFCNLFLFLDISWGEKFIPKQGWLVGGFGKPQREDKPFRKCPLGK